MLKKILLVLALVIVAFVIVVATRPADFTITRKHILAAPPAAVFAQVNDFHNWQAWSPWAKLDPDAKYTFEGPESGVGAKFSWTGNNQVGVGSNEIVESVPNEKVRIKLVFVKPFPATNEATFGFVPEGEGTEVTWTMTGKNNFIGKAIGLFMDLDKMVGAQFEEGLANLEKVATNPETSTEPQPE